MALALAPEGAKWPELGFLRRNHCYVNDGLDSLSEAQEDELDMVEEAPVVRMISRLSCQCRITGPGPIVAEVPAWNRNAVSEGS